MPHDASVLVVDASVVIDLLGRFKPEPIEELVLAQNVALAAPALIDVEVLQVLRRLEAMKAIRSDIDSVLEMYYSLPIRRYQHESLLKIIWGFRKNLTAYDAAYLALAQVLDATLITRDKKLAKAPKTNVQVIVP